MRFGKGIMIRNSDTTVTQTSVTLFPIFFFYSVIQSDGHSFYGDVVSDSFHKASADEDNILEQIYRSKYVWIFIVKILNFKSDGQNAY